MKYLKATLLGSGALASLLLSSVLTSCQDEDYGYTTQQIRDSVYARNFEKMYGEIAEDQTWDFSSYYYYNLGLSGEGTRSGTDDNFHKTYNNWIDVDPDIVKWLNENMAEKQNHSSEVMEFHLSSDDEFYLLPIYQGQSSMMWDLYAEDANGNEHKIWGKSDDLRYKTDYRQWEEYFYLQSDTWSKTKDSYNLLTLSSALEKFKSRSGGCWDSNKGANNPNFVRMVINVPTIAGKPANETYLKGKFFFSYDEVYTPITSDNFPDFFNGLNSENIEDRNNGIVKFRADWNSKVNGGSLSFSANGNQVNLEPLLGKSYTYQVARKDSDGKEVKDQNGNTIYDTKNQTISNFDNFKFIIEDDNWVDGDHSFNPYSGDRIRIFVKYPWTDSDYTNLTTISDINTNITTNSDGYFKAHTISKNNIQTKLIKINAQNLGKDFKFNLKTTYVNEYDQRDNYAVLNDNHYSNKGAMNVIKYFSNGNEIFTDDKKTALKNKINGILESSETKLNDNYEYWILGCEDANLQYGDNDFNDVVYLLIGNKLPKLSFRSIIEKRYMIEDLGSTYDFDFNDIVVDVTEEVTSLEDDDHVCLKQTAKIVSLCGTIPFLVTIGDVAIGDGKFMNGRRSSLGNDYYSSYTTLSTETAYVKTLVDAHFNDGNYESHRIWNPSTNNIKVYVYPNINTDGATTVYYNGLSTNGSQNNVNGNNVQENVQEVQLVEFPKKGKFPYIIATDQNVNWMAENISIPASWLKTRPEGWDDWNAHGDQTYNPAGNLHEMWVLYNGDPVQTPTGNNWGGNLGIEKEVFNNASEGDVITIHSKDFSANSALGFKQKDNGYNPIPGIGNSGNFYNVNGDISVTITQGILSSLQSYGLVFNGHDITFVKVTLTHKKSSGTGSN